MDPDELRQFALSLPEATEEPHFHYASFRVKGRIFVTMPPGEKYAHIFVDDEQRDEAINLYPRSVETLLWGKKAAGVRVLLSKTPSRFVRDLTLCAWKRKAPKSLIKAAV